MRSSDDASPIDRAIPAVSTPAASHRSPTTDAPALDSPPRWLNRAERSTWLTLVGMMVKLPAALDAQLQKDSGLSYIEYMVLAMLSEQPNRMLRMSELAGHINASLSRLSHVAKRLERQDLLRREPDPVDGRYTNAVLTDAGLAAVQRSAPGHVTAVRSLIFDALTHEQRDALHDAGASIMARVDPDAMRMAQAPVADS